MLHCTHGHVAHSLEPDSMMGKPVIEGTRITVELIQTRFAEGRTINDILEECPHLAREPVEMARAHSW